MGDPDELRNELDHILYPDFDLVLPAYTNDELNLYQRLLIEIITHGFECIQSRILKPFFRIKEEDTDTYLINDYFPIALEGQLPETLDFDCYVDVIYDGRTPKNVYGLVWSFQTDLRHFGSLEHETPILEAFDTKMEEASDIFLEKQAPMVVSYMNSVDEINALSFVHKIDMETKQWSIKIL